MCLDLQEWRGAMKVLVDGRPTLGGIHRYTSELCALLVRDGGAAEVDFFCRSAAGRPVGPGGTGHPWPVISGLRQVLVEQCLLPFSAWRLQADVLHVPHSLAPWFARTRTVATCHDLWLLEGFATKHRGWKRHYDRWKLRHALTSADHVITLSKAVAEKLIKSNMDPNRITTIPPPLATFPLDTSLPSPATPFFLAVGVLEPRKNLDRLLQAQAAAFKRTGVPLLLVGPYGWRSAKTLAAISKVAPAARWLGRLPDSRLASLYQHAAALIQFSLDEGFSYPVAEAMSYGLPLVLSDIPVHHELAGDCALYVAPDDPESLELALEKVLNWTPGCRGRMAAMSRAIIEKIRQEGKAGRYLEVYRKVMTQPKRRKRMKSSDLLP